MKKVSILIIALYFINGIAQVISVGETKAIVNFGSYEGTKLLIYDSIHDLYWYDGSWSDDPMLLDGYTSIQFPVEITGLVPGRRYCLKVVGLTGADFVALSSTYCFNTSVTPIKRFTSWDSLYATVGVFDTIHSNLVVFFPYNVEPPHITGVLYLKESGDADTMMYWNGVRWVKLIEIGSSGLFPLHDGSGIKGGSYDGSAEITWYIEPSATIDTTGDQLSVRDESIDSIKIKNSSISTSDIAPTGSDGQILMIDNGEVVWGDAGGMAPSEHKWDVMVTNNDLNKEWRTPPGLKRASTTNFIIYRY